MEIKILVKFGCFFGIDDFFRMFEFLSDDVEVVMLVGLMFVFIGFNEIWFSFNKYNIMLYKNVWEGYSMFFVICVVFVGD